MRKLKCIAVDDEPLALDILQDYIQKVPFLEYQGRFESAVEALNFMKLHQTELIFLDVQMEELTGIQFIRIMDARPQVILTTAYSSYALEGYELDVTDYLLKPISFDRFLQAANKAYDRFKMTWNEKTQNADELTIGHPRIDYFFVKTEYRLQKVNFTDIQYIEGQGDYLKIVTREEQIMTLQNFKKMEEILPKGHFFRIHRSYIISIGHITNIEKSQVYIGEKAIPIGSTYREEFFELLNTKGVI